ncbi:MAG: hypothetical protein CMH56_16215 [Myxococcales bacterium]|mgnify:CR=1 FL=1|nr:hypothetical protein [Myxococcales bacterium]|tara:strand:- start:4156 stop:5142 length:987 start_codon:yes stop_codon:yes gene_type:complete
MKFVMKISDCSNVDILRLQILENNSRIPSFYKAFYVYREEWIKYPPHKDAVSKIKLVGESIRRIAKSELGGKGRGEATAAGKAFESIVVWYFNLLFWELPVVVMSHNKAPQIFSDITQVSVNGESVNPATDLFAFSIPDSSLWNGDFNDLNDHLADRIGAVDFTIIHTKTNWNDTVQLPMLWNLIYNVKDFRIPDIQTGKSEISTGSTRSTKYAFVTLPSQSNLKKFKPNVQPVIRAKTLSGGNYISAATIPDVAYALHEFPSKNFSDQIQKTTSGSYWDHVSRVHQETPDLLDRFLTFGFGPDQLSPEQEGSIWDEEDSIANLDFFN